MLNNLHEKTEHVKTKTATQQSPALQHTTSPHNRQQQNQHICHLIVVLCRNGICIVYLDFGTENVSQLSQNVFVKKCNTVNPKIHDILGHRAWRKHRNTFYQFLFLKLSQKTKNVRQNHGNTVIHHSSPRIRCLQLWWTLVST